MKLKVSKVMAKYIKNVLAKNGVNVESVEVRDCALERYDFLTGYDWLDAEFYGDTYMNNEGYMRARFLQVIYPYGDYACPRTITTKELVTEYKRHGGDFERMIVELIAI